MISGIDEKTGQPLALKRIPKKVLDKEDFIKLFITQLEYQDPMKPIDNNEMAVQLALFNQVDQLFKINETLEKLMEIRKNSDLNLATGLIGKYVKIKGNEGLVEDGKFMGGEFEVDEPVNVLNITIRDKDGKVIKNIQLNNVTKGVHKIEWDATDNEGNKVPDGTYTFTITDPTKNPPEEITPTMIAKITSVILGDEIKVMANGDDEIKLSDIKEILGR